MVIIGLLNLEPKYKNLALEKIRLFHTMRGDTVEDYFPLRHGQYDKIYCSSIFQFTPKENLPPKMIIGGTGFDLTTTLPPEIESIKPHLNFGFTSRGCIRKCGFCVVPAKEGYVRPVGDLLDLWDGVHRDIVLYDNNILALPEHFRLICEQAVANHLRLDFNQGLDHRLLNEDNIGMLKSLSHSEYRFSYDDPSYFKTVDSAITLLQQHGINRCLWYCLVGYNTTFEQDLERVEYLKSRNQNAYIQRYTRDRRYISLSRWVNQHHIFHGMTWQQFQIAESKIKAACRGK